MDHESGKKAFNKLNKAIHACNKTLEQVWYTKGLMMFKMRNTGLCKLQRDGLLIHGNSIISSWTRNGQPNGAISVIVNTGGVRLIYRHGGDTGQDMDYPVMIDWTPRNYGGRRVALLYSGKMFSCRNCQQLAYASSRVAKGDKPNRQANKIRARLGWGGGGCA